MTDASANRELPQPWPFDQPPNCVAVTSGRIIHQNLPILHVYHDADDDGWQFLDGGEFTMDDALLVSMKTIVLHDLTVADVANLPSGWMATRIGPGQPWNHRPQ